MSHFQAIEFAIEQNDPDIWDSLIRASLSKPGEIHLYSLLIEDFIAGLLNNVGTHINPCRLIKVKALWW